MNQLAKELKSRLDNKERDIDAHRKHQLINESLERVFSVVQIIISLLETAKASKTKITLTSESIEQLLALQYCVYSSSLDLYVLNNFKGEKLMEYLSELQKKVTKGKEAA